MIPITTPKGTFNVWTKRFGNGPNQSAPAARRARGDARVLRGGGELLPRRRHRVYDPTSSGPYHSDQPADDALWTIDRFVDEVEQVRRALGLEQFYLLGHSWGGILATEYALAHQQHLKGLVISNMMASAPDYAAYNRDVLQKQIDPKVLAQIQAMDRRARPPTRVHGAARGLLRGALCRLQPMPEPVQRAFKHLNARCTP